LTRVEKLQFSIKTPEPQIKQKNPRSSEKKPAVATLVFSTVLPLCCEEKLQNLP